MAKVVLIALILVVVSLGRVRADVESRAPVAIDPRLHHLGAIEGKTYYMDDSPTYTWGQARNFCLNSGLRLAAIKTLVQHNFLTSKHPILGTYKHYWLGARDYRSLDNYTWFYAGGQFIPFHYFETNRALSFVVWSAPSKSAVVERWEMEPTRVLCESY